MCASQCESAWSWGSDLLYCAALPMTFSNPFIQVESNRRLSSEEGKVANFSLSAAQA